MEYALASSSSESLLQQLDFSLPNSSNFITARENTSWYPSSASSLTPTGVKVARFTISDATGWLDPTTLRIQYTIHNTKSSGSHKFTGRDGQNNAHLAFERIVLRCAGTTVEDVWYANRVQTMLTQCQPENHNLNEGVMGFAVGKSTSGDLSQQGKQLPLPAGDTYTVSFKPISCGMFRSCKQYMPIFACPLQIELFLTSNTADLFQEASNSFALENVQINAHMVQLDSQLQASFQKHLLDGKTLTIPYSQVITQAVPLSSGFTDASCTASRAVTRLESVFVTFSDKADASRLTNPDLNFCQAIQHNGDLVDFDPTFWLTIGSHRYPNDKPIQGFCQYYQNLRAALGLLMNSQDIATTSLDPGHYAWLSFIVGLTTSKVPGGFASGQNLRQGDLLRFDLRNCPTSVGDNVRSEFGDVVTMAYIHMVATSLLELSGSGAAVYD